MAPAASQAQNGATVLKPDALEKLIPATVFYRGQTATTQLRNSGGIRFADGYLVLTSMVDTSGYSDAVIAKYQAIFIAEVPIKIGGKELAAGVYGIGFVAGDKFLVTDIGGHDLLSVPSANDASLKRPTPLEIVADAGGGFRLYTGRRYVVLSR
jgi:hypothetical protein